MDIINRLESDVRGYVRSFPTVFTVAKGSRMTDEQGKSYVDFFAGAGALNYGHNEDDIKAALLEYIESDYITHSLDMASSSKVDFLSTFEEVVMKPRDMEYKIQFPGPTGTNAVEAALKIARKATGRDRVLYFTNGYHGMTLGALAVTGNASKRAGAGVSLDHSTPLPYSNYFRDGRDTAADLEHMLEDTSSGLEKPAAVILETVQGEGGVNVADFDWLKKVESVCRANDVLLIVDDIQAGIGRTGPFFSFEPAGIKPDIITLSKSLSGYGLPLAITMIRPDLDVWDPGEHNGTFRGNCHAFATAVVAMNKYWRDDALEKSVQDKSERVLKRLEAMVEQRDRLDAVVRGRGLFIGIDCAAEGLADEISEACFERGLILETAGPTDNVLKLMPSLIIEDELLAEGLDILEAGIDAALAAHNQ